MLVNIGNARLYGLEEDLGLEGNQYQVAVSILFVTYCVGNISFLEDWQRSDIITAVRGAVEPGHQETHPLALHRGNLGHMGYHSDAHRHHSELR